MSEPPNSSEPDERRRHIRVSPEGPATAKLAIGDPRSSEEFRITDLSEGGVLLRAVDTKVEGGEEVKLTLSLGGGDSIPIAGRVVRAAVQASGHSDLAIAFEDLDESACAAIREAVIDSLEAELVNMRLEDFMTHDVAQVHPDTPLVEAIRTMKDNAFSCAIVTDGGKPVGILTERDSNRMLLACLESEEIAPTVGAHMTAPVTSMHRKTSLSQAMGETQRQSIRHLPVVGHDGELVGLVTQTDLLRAERKMVRQIVTVVSKTEAALAGQNGQTGADVAAMKSVPGALLSDVRTRLQQRIQDLEESRKRAESLTRAKSRFLANMSHEIRTPLNGVIGATGLLVEMGLTDEQRDYVDIIRCSGDLLLEVINNVLDYSKAEAGQLTLEEIPFDLRHLVEDVVDQIALLAMDKSIEVIADYDGPEDRVLADPGRIRQILTNLLGNAVKFTQKGHVLVRVTQGGDDQPFVRVEVEDTGIGICVDDQSRIFDVFAQVDDSAKRKYQGTGLGLAICKELVDCMGGAIGVSSTPGRGSTFWFTLPLRAGTAPGPQQSRASLQNLRILVADDSHLSRAILEKQVSAWDMRLTAVSNREDAQSQLRVANSDNDAFDVVLLDRSLATDADGSMSAALSGDELGNPAMVLLSTIGLRGDAQKARDAGFAGYLVKPIHQSSLMDVLAVVWANHLSGQTTDLVTRHSVADSRSKCVGPKRGSATPIRVLVAEDNPINQKVVTRMLTRLDCVVELACNGAEAVRMVESSTYDVIFMDCQMPDMDGLEATRRIRAPGCTVRIIALTANAMEGDRRACLAAGMDDYLTKPVTMEKLSAALMSWTQAQPPISAAG